MIKIPYGISNFKQFVTNGYYFVDRTDYIEQLEQLNQRYLFFVRPRRFGKSLFISILEHYYGIQHKAVFQELFGQYYIGKQPTQLANSYLILLFDFSQIDTSSFENTYNSFLNNVKKGAFAFMNTYKEFFDKTDLEEVKSSTFPAEVIQYLSLVIKTKAPEQKIYLLIDEYDHFANEILAFRFDEFSQIVSENGYVRKFFEAIKTATRDGVVDRLFITGVSPITLDSLTSGFNMGTNISLRGEFNTMMGFTEEEVITILKGVGVPNQQLEEVVTEIREWYDGYRFSEETEEKIYNSDMVLYFAEHYNRTKEYPKDLLDLNIASDYSKIRRLFKIKNNEKEHLSYLDELLKTGTIEAQLVRQFNFERRFNRHDFISLLYYTGIITIHKESLDALIFKMPNYVVKQLYYQYFHQVILEYSQLDGDQVDVHAKIKALALQNDIQPLVSFTQEILTELSNRDKQNFDEKYIKTIFTAALFTSGIYTIRNEFEVKQSLTQKGFVDILLIRRPPYQPKYQFVIELKYLKKKDASSTQKVKKEAIQQLKRYLQNDAYLQQLTDLKAYVIIFTGNEGIVEEVKIK